MASLMESPSSLVTPVTEETDAETGETTWIPGTPVQDQPWLAWSRRYDMGLLHV